MPESDGDEVATTKQPWSWFPTLTGAVRREDVRSFSVERVDGDFKGGHTSMWTIHLYGIGLGEDGVLMRPTFFDATQLCVWVDGVFPGSSFTLLPPNAVTDAPGWSASEYEGARFASGHGITDAIRTIGDGLSGGNDYEPAQGYRPPAGAAPVSI